jgi:hypothetical protein
MWFTTTMKFRNPNTEGTLTKAGDLGNLRTLGIVSGATVGAGALGLLLSKIIGFSCPFRSMGFACPGCGCSRAVESLVQHGPLEMLRAQPTATIFLLFIGISLAASLSGYVFTKSKVVSIVNYSQVLLILVLLSASSNWIYQLVNTN